jgi:hypothetical protein
MCYFQEKIMQVPKFVMRFHETFSFRRLLKFGGMKRLEIFWDFGGESGEALSEYWRLSDSEVLRLTMGGYVVIDWMTWKKRLEQV